MKKHLLIIVMVVISMTTMAQNMSFTEDTKSVAVFTELAIADTVYNAVVTRTGSYKIERISKSGNTYWMYLGYKTSEKYHGADVWTNKDKDEYFYYTVGKTGYPKKRKLNVE